LAASFGNFSPMLQALPYLLTVHELRFLGKARFGKWVRTGRILFVWLPKLALHHPRWPTTFSARVCGASTGHLMGAG
jgi:hypothetical protein